MLHVHVIDELRTGGAQTHLITMLREVYSTRDIEHRVVSLFGDGELSGEIRNLGIPVDILDLRPHLHNRQFFAAAAELRQLFERVHPDLVEAHLTWSRLLALYAAWRCGVPQRIGFEQGDLYMNSWKCRLSNFSLQFCAQRIVVCSEALAEWVRRTHGIARSRLLVLHNCVDLRRFQSNGKLAGDIAFPEGETIFVAVGTLGRGVNKRVDVCIRALAAARSAGARVALVICGDGEQRTELEILARSLGIAPRVKFLGTRFDIPEVLRACHVFCHAAPWEPFGIVAIEAMAASLPIIVPDAGGIREILAGGEGGLLYPALDHEALGKAMVKLATNHSLRPAMGAAGRRMVEERFSVRGYMERLYQAYGIRHYPPAPAPTEVYA